MPDSQPSGNHILSETHSRAQHVVFSSAGLFKRLLDNGYTPIPIGPYDADIYTRNVKNPSGFETRPGGKAPAEYDPADGRWHGYRNWQNFYDTPPTERTIKRWAGFPACNVGLLTGRIVAIDVDVTHPGLADAIKKDDTLSQGLIRYGSRPKFLSLFRLPEEDHGLTKMRSAAFTIGDYHDQRIEILGRGQQFVAHGIHPKTGALYEWEGEHNPLHVPVASLPVIPADALKDLITRFEQLALYQFDGLQTSDNYLNGEHTQATDHLIDKRGLIADAINALPDALADTYDTWVRTGHAIKAAFDDQAEALQAWHAFSAKCEHKYDPEQTAAKFDTFHPERIGAGTLYKLAKDHGWSPPIELPEDVFESVVSSQGDDPVDRSIGGSLIVDIRDVAAKAIPARQWLLGHHLMRGQVTTLIAPGGVGKSTLSILWALSLTTHKNLLNTTPHEHIPVWVINNEDDTYELARRYHAALTHYDIDSTHAKPFYATGNINDRPFKIARRIDNTLQPTDQFKELYSTIKRYHIGAVIIDPLVSIHDANENDNTEMEYILSLLRTIARKTNCAIVIVHHSNKPQGGQSAGFTGNQNTARGASAITNASRIALTLYDMSEQDAKHYRIHEHDRNRYLRLDDAKANLSLRSPTPNWLYRQSVTLPNGDSVGTLSPITLKAPVEEVSDDITTLLLGNPGVRLSLNHNKPAALHFNDACRYLQQVYFFPDTMELKTAKGIFKKHYANPVTRESSIIQLHPTTKNTLLIANNDHNNDDLPEILL